jgi:hypothetical protein
LTACGVSAVSAGEEEVIPLPDVAVAELELYMISPKVMTDSITQHNISRTAADGVELATV